MTTSIVSCDQEPIHALGMIQGHGALVAFDADGNLIARSLNAPSLIGVLPAAGLPCDETHLDAVARAAIARALADPQAPIESVPCSGANDQTFNLVLHWSQGVLIAEWEAAAADAPSAGHFAALLQRAIQHLHGSIALPLDKLLQVAANSVQLLTGFDRVMAYRFLADGSGEVVAESIRGDAPSYLNLRYPSGDIPAQARRLYVVNPVRHIANVWSTPVPIHIESKSAAHVSIDLTHSTLRSVSPIHIEYLKNMGVVASMSISIVVNGKLWGLIACHHLKSLCPSFAVRTSCTVLGQVLAIMVERAELAARSSAESQIDVLRGQVAAALTSAEDTISALIGASDAMRGLIPSDGFSIVVGQRVTSFPDTLSRDAAIDVADHMTASRLDMLVTKSIVNDLSALERVQREKGNKSGILAIQMNADPVITVMWWRTELIETIDWAGAREKPAGDDVLTPRKSFALWQETVRGSSQAWTNTSQFAARELKFVLQELALNQMLAVSDEHAALLAIMGHDLRDPLQAIDMVVTLMSRGRISSDDGAKRIAYSSHRMQSLISYILDVSHLRAGLGLAMASKATPLKPLLIETLDHALVAHPGVELRGEFGELGDVMLDRDRFIQAISNLLSNARQHGDMRYPIQVQASRQDGLSVIEVKNKITAGQQFRPGPMTSQFKKKAMINPLNKQGMGMGLYIANAIIEGHGGSLESGCSGLDVTFKITLNG